MKAFLLSLVSVLALCSVVNAQSLNSVQMYNVTTNGLVYYGQNGAELTDNGFYNNAAFSVDIYVDNPCENAAVTLKITYFDPATWFVVDVQNIWLRPTTSYHHETTLYIKPGLTNAVMYMEVTLKCGATVVDYETYWSTVY